MFLLVLRRFLVKYCFFNRLEETFKLFCNLIDLHFSQPPKIDDVIVSRVHTWLLDSYVLNGVVVK